MAEQFETQLNGLDQVLEAYYAGTARITLCVSSGISSRCLPSLSELISCAIGAFPQSPQAEELFARYRDEYRFADKITEIGFESPQPFTLEAFRELSVEAKLAACRPLAQNYGDVFQELIPIFGDKRSLLAAIRFERFQQGVPDSAHYYLAYLFVEDKLQKIVSLNWDCLIEKALQDVGGSKRLNIIRDEPSWLQRNDGPEEILAKVHGCATQYPELCENIVLSARDVEVATSKQWIQDMLRDFLNGIVIYCGYRARDSTVNVPIRAIEDLRRRSALPPANYYMAQEDQVEARAFSALLHEDASRQIHLNANDLFSSIYFGWLRARLREVVRSGRSRNRIERPFSWTDEDWEAAMNRVHALVEHEVPGVLDHVLGLPGQRSWNSDCAYLPLKLSLVRSLYLDGKIEDSRAYKNFQFGDMTHDLVLLIVFSVLVDIVREEVFLHLSLDGAECGLRLLDSRTGSIRRIILYRGRFAPTSFAVLMAYLTELDSQIEGGVAPEVFVIPCEKYEIGSENLDLAPGPVVEGQFPGSQQAIMKFIHPDTILRAQNLQHLKAALKSELDVA